MEFFTGLSILAAPILGFTFIAIDYARHRSVDEVQRRIVFFIIGVATAAIFSELCYDLFAGKPGALAYNAVYWSNVVYFVFQFIAYASVMIYIDYSANRDPRRIGKLCVIIGALCVVNIALLILNTGRGFYFYIDEGNRYVRGDMYFLRLLVSYAPLPFTAADLYLSRKNVTRHQINLLLLFFVPTCIGAMMDLFAPGSRLVWPCFFCTVLFAYLFIIGAETRTDSLTGLHNRRSCEEYLASLARSSRLEAYTFIMIDMDGFKQINDLYGHAEGDKALCTVAELLRGSVRRFDFAARYGGDEFLLILKSHALADETVARIQSNLQAFNDSRAHPYTLSMSIGCDVYEAADTRTPWAFLGHVDQLMYRSKQERRLYDTEAPPAQG